MDKNKVENLAKSFSQSCKRVVKSDHLTLTLSSPTLVLIAITVIKVLEMDIGIDKRPGWGR